MTQANERFNLRRFLLSGAGWPYLLVPFIPLAIALARYFDRPVEEIFHVDR